MSISKCLTTTGVGGDGGAYTASVNFDDLTDLQHTIYKKSYNILCGPFSPNGVSGFLLITCVGSQLAVAI